MLDWYRLLQEVPCDLKKAAKIILEQNPNALEWAQRRLVEFYRTLFLNYDLLPNLNLNGFDWTGYHDDDKDDLIFFDHYYGKPDDPPDIASVSLRLGLRCREGEANAVTTFESKLSLDFQTDDDSSLGSGYITLIGRRGVWWYLEGTFYAQDQNQVQTLVDHFEPFVSNYYVDLGIYRADFQGHVTAKQARECFKMMVQYFIANRG
jgi:hypothetical protein